MLNITTGNKDGAVRRPSSVLPEDLKGEIFCTKVLRRASAVLNQKESSADATLAES